MKKTDVNHCANYSNGKCDGIMIGKHLEQWIDQDLENKPCKIKSGKECEYFNKIVINGIKHLI